MLRFDAKLVHFLALFLLYFVQAMPYGFQRYLSLVMRREGVSLTSIGLFKLLLLPWVCKVFLSAFVVDAYKTKRFWLILSMLVLAVGSYTGVFIHDFTLLACVIFLLNWASATQDICVDWYSMNLLDESDLGMGNTIQVGAFKLGTLFSGGVLVYLMDYISVSSTFAVLGSVYLLSLLLLLKLPFLDSERQSDDKTAKGVELADEATNASQMSLREKTLLVFKSPGTAWTCVFVLIYKLGEQSSLNLMPVYLLDRGVGSSTIGLWTGILGQVVSILGSFIGGLVIKYNTQRRSTADWLKYTIIVRNIPIALLTYAVVCNEGSLNLTSSTTRSSQMDDALLNSVLCLVLVQLFLSGFLTTICFTVMMKISFMSPKSIQATHFSLLATCEVLGKLLFQPVASSFADYWGYSLAFVLFALLYFICVLLIHFMPQCLCNAHSSPKTTGTVTSSSNNANESKPKIQ